MTYGIVFPIAPNDTNNLPQIALAIYIGATGGTLTVETLDGRQVQFGGLVVGTVLPVQVRKVLATGTACTLLLGLAN